MATFQTQHRSPIKETRIMDSNLNEWTMYPDTYGGAEFIYDADERLSIIMDCNGDCEAYYGLAEQITYYSSMPVVTGKNLEDTKAAALNFLRSK